MTEQFARSRPRVGDPITYQGKVNGRVHSVEDNLCWNAYADGRGPLPFIWRFKDGLNAMHDWPTKHPDDPLTFCPGITPYRGDPV